MIDSIALLHQMQRPVKTAQLNGQVIEYIEVTLADIAQANWLAHEVLGRSLDELPPQTRNLLVLLRDLVHTWAQAQGVARSDIRFSRRALRAACGWGDTQLKVHLARLTELEYLVVHRAGASAGRVTSQGASYQYELLYDGDGRQAPYLSGLIDPVSLGYDGVQSVVSSTPSGTGRDEVGAESASGHMGVSVAMPIVVRHSADRVNESPLTRHPLNGQAGSYLQDSTHAQVMPPLVAAGG